MLTKIDKFNDEKIFLNGFFIFQFKHVKTCSNRISFASEKVGIKSFQSNFAKYIRRAVAFNVKLFMQIPELQAPTRLDLLKLPNPLISRVEKLRIAKLAERLFISTIKSFFLKAFKAERRK